MVHIDRVLVCWNFGAALFLGLIYYWMTRLTAEQNLFAVHRRGRVGALILAVVTAAALLSVVAIVEPLANIRHTGGVVRSAHFALAALTLVNSWVLVPTIFTTHYADLFYSSKAGQRPLRFPETEMPVFWDFAYFSFTIAAACQTADVTTLNAGVRRLVIAHTVISFFFNASILGRITPPA
jgi:uncharacterized membrane protein